MIYLKALILITVTIAALCLTCFLIMFTYEMWDDSGMKRDLMARKKRRDDK